MRYVALISSWSTSRPWGGRSDDCGLVNFVVLRERDLVRLDLTAVTVAVVSQQDTQLNQVGDLVVQHVVGAVGLAPDGHDVPVMALDHTAVGVDHGAGRRQLLVDEAEVSRVLVHIPQVGQHGNCCVEPLRLEDLDGGLGDDLRHAVDDHRTGVVAHALAGRRGLGQVGDPDGCAAVAGAVAADRDTVGRLNLLAASFRSHDDFQNGGDGAHSVGGSFGGMVHVCPFPGKKVFPLGESRR